MKILVLNCGSSSLKFALIELPNYQVLTSGNEERVGINDSFITFRNLAGEKVKRHYDIPNHTRGVEIILDILKERGIHATFYVIGSMAEAHPDVLKRIFAEGHAIGNHSYSHRYDILYPNKENFLEEIVHTDEVIYNILGVRPLIVRAPGGAASMFKPGYSAMLKENGYVNHDCNVSSEDATGNNVSVQKILGSISYTCANRPKDRGAIVLMHSKDGKETTVEALPAIIDMLQGAGFTFGVMTPRTAQPW